MKATGTPSGTSTAQAVRPTPTVAVPPILLAHSFFMAHDSKQRDRMQPYSPLSTLITAALLRDAGHAVALFDATFASGLPAFAAALEAAGSDMVLIVEDNFNFLTKMCTATRRESVIAMIATARARGCRVAVNGPDAADNPALYLAAGADAVVLGEGELAMAELAARWQQRLPIDDVAGLVLPSLDRTAPRAVLEQPDLLPHPATDLVDIAAYRQAWIAAHGYFSWNIVASRGCPYGCNWCAKPSFGRRYSVRAPHDVVAEMAAIKARIAPDRLWFADDILGLDGEWLRQFADALDQTAAHIPFTLQSRVNLMRDDTVAALARAGAREVWLGVESGAQAIIDAMDKGSTVAQARTATRRLRAAGIRVGWFIQLGYPGEGWDEILATRDLIRAEAPDEIGVSVAYPLPGTAFFDRVRAQLGPRRHWQDTGELAMLFQGTFDTAFYRELRDLLHHEVTTGLPQDARWHALAERAHQHRSPSPSRLASLA